MTREQERTIRDRCLVIFWVVVFIVVMACASFAFGQNRWTSRMDTLAHKTEAEFVLPHGTCQAFALQESNYDTLAVRVEVGYFNDGSRYWKKISSDSKTFLDSMGYQEPLYNERSQRSISTGLFQIMGENIRIMGYLKEFIYLSIEEQFHYFGTFVAPLFKKYRSLARVASAYNSGSPNQSSGRYAKNIVRYRKQFSY